MSKVQSEHAFFWKWILRILITPWILLLFFFGKRSWKEVMTPFVMLKEFFFEPKATVSLILLNIILFVFSAFLPTDLLNQLVLYPSDLFEGRFYTIITAGFLHANLLHLFSNMLGLFIFGRIVERSLGPKKMLGIYFGAMVLAGIFHSLIAQYLLVDPTGAVGASGALLGLVSAAMLLDPWYLVYLFGIPIPVMVLSWITILADITGVLQATDDGIAHFAHLGGFLSIGILMFFLGGKTKDQLKKGFFINIISLMVLVSGYFLFQYLWF